MGKTKTEGTTQETTEEEGTQPTESLYKVKALAYIKYDKENYKPGEEFNARKSDALDMADNGYVKKISEAPEEEGNSEDGE